MFAVLLSAKSVLGHGNMAWPPTWVEGQGAIELESYHTCGSGGCMWFNNNTSIYPRKATIGSDSPLRTYNWGPDLAPVTPWRAPGYAGPIHSPCGIQGGNPYGCPAHSGGADCPGGGFGFGDDAREAYVANKFDPQTTKWEAGSIQDVMWNIKANHGGGYAYRLCKVPVEGVTGVTEDCFQQGHLDFEGDMQWAQWGPDFKNRTEFKAMRTTTGTWPPNSSWTRNPVPACRNYDGGALTDKSDDCELNGGKFMFDPPAPGIHGYGEYSFNNWLSSFGFNIVDKVKIPADLVPGKYVLSFRWDCEQTPQVWNTCSDIEVTAPKQKAAQAPMKVLRNLDIANGL